MINEHETRERIQPGAAVRLRQRHADPAAFGEGAAEIRIEAHPRMRALFQRDPDGVGADEIANCRAQCFSVWRNGSQ